MEQQTQTEDPTRELPKQPDPSEFEDMEKYFKALGRYLHDRDVFLRKTLSELQFYMAECNRLQNALKNEDAKVALNRSQMRFLEYYGKDQQQSA